MLQEAHYCTLQSQSNIYGLTKIKMPCGRHKILATSASRHRVISMGFQKTTPSSTEIQFAYIPSGAEIVSIDAFNKSSGVVMIGITFIKMNNSDKMNRFLNIYSDLGPTSDFNLDNIAQGCQCLELDFTPFQLYHTEILVQNNLETVFLLSGGDSAIHLYKEVERHQHNFQDKTEYLGDVFPELVNPQKLITWMEIQYYSDHQFRMTALGANDGTVDVSLVDVEKTEILQHWSIQHDSMITRVALFMVSNDVPCPPFFTADDDLLEDSSDTDTPNYLLLVVSAVEAAVVYKNIIDKGLTDGTVLAGSDGYDCVQCAALMDVDFDGYNEILLGTYGQQLLVYKYHPRRMTSNSMSLVDSAKEATEEDDLGSGGSGSAGELPVPLCAQDYVGGDFKLLYRKNFSDPLIAIDTVDVTGDGLDEVALVSLKGLHLLQHDIEAVSELCKERLEEAMNSAPEQDAFHQLMSEPL